MKRAWWALAIAGIACAGCSTPPDQGVVMACFGVINQTVPGPVVVSNQVVTNLYFGGCSPADNTGMQIVERVTAAAAADADKMAQICNTDCAGRIAAYQAAHTELQPVTSQLQCQSLFAAPCDGISADVSTLSGEAGEFQLGGPADQRFTLTGTVTVKVAGQSSVPVNIASGLMDGTTGKCTGTGPTCPITISRLDVVTTDSFTLSGVAVTGAEIHNQGVGVAHSTGSTFSLDTLEIEVNAALNGTPTSFHLRNVSQGFTNAGITSFSQFAQRLNTLTFSNTDPATGKLVTVTINMSGTLAGQLPVASMSPSTDNTKYECTCAECTTVSFTSTATDPDNDLQSLAWVLDTALQGADGTSAPPELDLQLGLLPPPASNTHTVSLVATDTRGAMSISSHAFSIVDSTPPTITPPPPLTIRSCDFPYLGQATASDICSGQAAITNNSPGVFPVGTTVVTWTAEDCFWESVECHAVGNGSKGG